MAEKQDNQQIAPPVDSIPATAPKNKGGRPKVAIDWQVFEALCTCRSTLEELASYFRCDVRTIERNVKKQYGISFAAFYRERAAIGNTSIRRKQFQQAMKGDSRLLIWLGKNWLGQNDTIEVSGPGGGPIPHEIDTKDRETLEREITAFFAGLKFGEQQHRERIGRGSPAVIDAEPARLHPAPLEETGEVKG